MTAQMPLEIPPREHLERVTSRIAEVIVQFCREHPIFHADELRRHVSDCVGYVAPGSPDRILRDLRQRGVLSYRVVDRRASIYEVTR